MNIEDLTIKEARQLAAMFGGNGPATQPVHPMVGRYVVIRTYSAGVHVGVLRSVSGKEVVLTNSRRIYTWLGAFTLSAVATTGIKDGKMTVALPEIALTEAIEIIPCSADAETNLRGFKVHAP